MKKIIKHRILIVAVAIISFCCSGNKSMAQAGVPVSYQTFYDDLSPYGTWIDYPAYGHVWHPSITGDFRPYLTNGYWDYSAEGWMWQSNYDWGWAPFHYGRWMYDDSYGWLWLPGYEWSPAWVTWGNVDNFYAWAPLMPEVNVGIAFSSWRPAAMYWNFVGRDHIADRDIFRHVEKRDVVSRYANQVTVINNFSNTNVHNQYYSKGPDVNDVQRYTNRAIKPAPINAMRNAGVGKHDGNSIQVYRPAIANPQPRQFRRADNNTTPIRTDQDRMNNGENEQRQNVDRLPVRKAPPSSFGNSGNAGNRGNNGRGNRRNK